MGMYLASPASPYWTRPQEGYFAGLIIYGNAV